MAGFCCLVSIVLFGSGLVCLVPRRALLPIGRRPDMFWPARVLGDPVLFRLLLCCGSAH